MTRLGQMVRGFSQGFGRGVAGFTSGAQAEQAGFDARLGAETKLAQALAQIRAADANAERDTEAAGLTRTQRGMLEQRPGMFEELAALQANVDLPTLRAFRQTVQTGEAPMVPMGPPAEDGGMGMGSVQFSPEQRGRLAQALTRVLPLSGNTGDINPQQWAAALGAFREQDLGDDVLAGRRTAGAVGSSQAAVAGRPLFNSDANGAVLDLFGGALDTSNPMAGAAINLRNQQAGQARAAAAENWAQAAAARAAAAEGANRAGAKAPTGYRWAADGKTLEAIPGGPADPSTKGAKLQRPPTEGQAKAIGFGSRMFVSDEIINELGDNYSFGAVAAAKGAETLPLIGGIVGRLSNAALDANSQMALQAQRDFINAILRRESGAAIGADEFANAALQYFPQPGDSQAVIKQKAINRKVAINAMKAEFGEAYLPDFQKAVDEARKKRKEQTAPEGSWDAPAAPAAPPGWNIVRER